MATHSKMKMNAYEISKNIAPIKDECAYSHSHFEDAFDEVDDDVEEEQKAKNENPLETVVKKPLVALSVVQREPFNKEEVPGCREGCCKKREASKIQRHRDNSSCRPQCAAGSKDKL
eukprot:Gb_30846 [translate_table: standard]